MIFSIALGKDKIEGGGSVNWIERGRGEVAITEVKKLVKLEAEQKIPEHVAGIQMSNLYHIFVNTLAKCYCFDLLQ